jgi:hypothetical protein
VHASSNVSAVTQAAVLGRVRLLTALHGTQLSIMYAGISTALSLGVLLSDI